MAIVAVAMAIGAMTMAAFARHALANPRNCREISL